MTQTTISQSRSTDPEAVFGRRGPIGVRLDSRTGLLVGLAHRDGAIPDTAIAPAVTLVTGGVEKRSITGELVYEGTTRTALDELRLARTALDDQGSATRLVVTTEASGWELDFEYRLNERPPHVAFGFTVRRAPGCEPELVRDVQLTFTYRPDDPADCIVNAPGNQLRCDLPLANIATPVIVRGAGEGEGSPGLTAFTREATGRTTVLWPLSQTEIGEMELTVEDGCVRLAIDTTMAERLEPNGPGLTWQTAYLDSLAATWPEVRASVPGWWRALGIVPPSDTPQRLRQANVFETFVGFAILAGERLDAYPSVSALRDDLPRLERLGFDVIELMPRHPYPSYNVHDYADITTTYGDEAELRELVADAHTRGMRVLLDIIMHGVIDKEILDETLEAVLAGPHVDSFGHATMDFETRFWEEISWHRHIVDFAPYWREGSPDRHTLPEEHPEWFMRDSDQRISRRYTKSFDVANPDWQRYFIDACCSLVERLGVDGFRVDAPMYNNFHNWSAQRSGRASYAGLAPLNLLRDLRARLRAQFGDVAVYTEPTGSLWKSAADATYNYDEQWLMEALLAEPRPHWEQRFVRNGAELGRWLQDRDATLPPGAAIVHHIDSHDSMWWSPVGDRWRVERFGRDAAVALLAAFSLIGDAYMTFKGGEEGIEDELRRAHELRRRLPEIADGTVDYAGATASSEQVLTVLRVSPQGTSLVAVNMARTPVSCEIRLPRELSSPSVHDHWNDESIDVSAGSRSLSLAFAPFQPRVLRLDAPGDEG
jgi:hypothetical protein